MYIGGVGRRGEATKKKRKKSFPIQGGEGEERTGTRQGGDLDATEGGEGQSDDRGVEQIKLSRAEKGRKDGKTVSPQNSRGLRSNKQGGKRRKSPRYICCRCIKKREDCPPMPPRVVSTHGPRKKKRRRGKKKDMPEGDVAYKISGPVQARVGTEVFAVEKKRQNALLPPPTEKEEGKKGEDKGSGFHPRCRWCGGKMLGRISRKKGRRSNHGALRSNVLGKKKGKRKGVKDRL